VAQRSTLEWPSAVEWPSAARGPEDQLALLATASSPACATDESGASRPYRALSASARIHGEDDLGDPETIEVDWSGQVGDDEIAMHAVSARREADGLRFQFVK
jgi:hypothetical protein